MLKGQSHQKKYVSECFLAGKLLVWFLLFEKGSWSWNVLILPDPFNCGARTLSVNSTSENFCSRNGARACNHAHTPKLKPKDKHIIWRLEEDFDISAPFALRK